jgi:hypothetical protein
VRRQPATHLARDVFAGILLDEVSGFGESHGRVIGERLRKPFTLAMAERGRDHGRPPMESIAPRR